MQEPIHIGSINDIPFKREAFGLFSTLAIGTAATLQQDACKVISIFVFCDSHLTVNDSWIVFLQNTCLDRFFAFRPFP